MITLVLGPDDLLRCRFAISPLWETRAAVHAIAHPARNAVHLPWLRCAGERLAGLDLAPLLALLPAGGYSPDFLTPPPESPLAEVEQELERLRATPPEQVRAEIELTVEGREPTPVVREMLADPGGTRDRLADLLAQCWARLIARDWPRLRDLLEGDVLHRARCLAEGGMERVFADLHPDVSWRDGSVRVAQPYTERRELDGLGLLLVPTAFGWPKVSVQLDPPWQPTLIYPARGVGRLWERRERPPAQLAALLGRTRAALLVELAQPSSTTRLAARHGLAAGTVSAHLSVLKDAGLVTARRVGREVLYEQTPLGHALTAA